MSQPNAYIPSFDFGDWQGLNPSQQVPGDRLDVEFQAIRATLDQLIVNVAKIQRDDGKLGNQSVGVEQLKASLRLGINRTTSWAPERVYELNDAVYYGNGVFLCVLSHTSVSTLTPRDDVGETYWTPLLDLTDAVDTCTESAETAVVSGALAVASAVDAGDSAMLAVEAKADAESASAAAIVAAASVDLPSPVGNAWRILFSNDTNHWAISANFTWDGQTLYAGGSSAPKVRLRNTNYGVGTYFDLEQTGETNGALRKVTQTGAAVLELDAVPTDGTSSSTVRVGRRTTTTGVRVLDVCRGDGSNTVDHELKSGIGSTSYLAGDGGKVGIGRRNPAVTLDAGAATDAFQMPFGTNAQRPGSPVGGMIRYNSDIGRVEMYQFQGAGWAAMPALTSFTSSELGITSGGVITASAAHGLAGVPQLVRAVLVCKVAALGYAVGDEVMLTDSGYESGDAGQAVCSVWANATSVGIAYRFQGDSGSGQITIRNKSSGTNADVGAADPAKWNLKFYAILLA